MTVQIVCPYCGFSKEVPQEKIPKRAKFANCPKCRQRFPLPAGGPEEAPGREGEPLEEHHQGEAPPWEQRGELGLLKAILQTAKEVLFSPKRLFKGIRAKGGLSEPLAFGLLFGSLGMMLSVFWDVIMAAAGLGGQAGGMGPRFGLPLLLPVMLLVIPAFVLVSLFCLSGLIHLFLRLVGAGGGGFQATFRVMSYGQATQILAAIPLAGGLLSSVWFLIVQVVGFREIHHTSYPRVIMALLLPVALLFMLAAAVIIPLVIAFLR